MKAPRPPDEAERLQALRRYEILGTDPEPPFDDLARLAARICGTPVAMISLLDENREWFKARVGLTGSETPRGSAFGAHGILPAGVFVVRDARADERFAANPLVTGDPRIRFYAGVPLLTPDGQALGMLGVGDTVPRELGGEQREALQALGGQVVAQLEWRRSRAELRQTADRLKQAEAALQWKRAFLEAQVNSSLDAILVVDEHGKKLLQNQLMTELWKIPPHIADEIGDEDRLRWVTNLTKKPEQFVEKVAYLYAHPDETSRDEIELKDGRILDRYSAPVRGKEGKYYGRIWTFRDITGRQRAEEARRESEERFSGAFEHAPIGVALVSPDGRWLKVNRAICALVGYSEAELLARTFQDITHPDDLEADLENVRRMVAGEFRSYQMEKRYVHARGHLVTVLLDVSLVRDARGQPGYFIAQIQDITDRKRAERELANSLSVLHATLEATVDGILVVDGRGGLTHFNGKFAEMWRIPREILDAHDDERALGVAGGQLKDPGAFLAKVRELYARPEADSFDLLELKDGRIFERYSQPQRIGRAIVGRVWCFRDVTKRKRAELELAETHNQLLAVSRQAGMAEFATGILHNVGNVLNSVNVASSCLADSLRRSKSGNLAKVVALLREHEKDLGGFLTDDPKGRQVPVYLAHLAEHLAGEQAGALKELAQLQANIEHIKEIVVMQQGMAKGSVWSEMHQASDLMEEALKMNASALGRSDLRIIREYEEIPPLAVEKSKVLQILGNLVRNAEQACDESGRREKILTLRVTNQPGGVRLAVGDTGAGISAGNLPRIFTRGFTTKKDGHGFGLHGARRAAREMGGSLTVHSDGPEQGATFILDLPRRPVAPAHEIPAG